MNQKNEFEEKVFEVEKLTMVRGAPMYTKVLNDLEDGPPWFDARSGRTLSGLEEIQLPLGWKWTSNWKLHSFENEGWENRNSMVRQRKWIRRREKISSAPSTLLTSSSSSAPIQVTTLSPNNTNDEALVLEKCARCLLVLNEVILRLTAAKERKTRDAIIREGRETIAACQQHLSVLSQSDKPGVKVSRNKVTNDLAKDVKRFELAVAESMPLNNRQASDVAVWSSTVPTTDFSTIAQQQQQQQQVIIRKAQYLSQEVETNNLMLQERERDIAEVHKMTMQVNGMMKDLAQLVSAQEDDIQLIKRTTVQAKEDVQAGLKQVEKAERYQQEGGCQIS